MRLSNIYKGKYSTLLAIMIGAILCVFIWFEKLPAEVLITVLPLVLSDIFKENKKVTKYV